MYKGIHDILQFIGLGGFLSVVGGIVGKSIGNQIAGPCRNGCLGQLGTVTLDVCWSTCPDPWQYAVIGTIPGFLIGIIWYIKEKKEKADQLR